MQSEKWNLNRLDLWAEVALNLLNEAGAVFKGEDSYLAPRAEAALSAAGTYGWMVKTKGSPWKGTFYSSEPLFGQGVWDREDYEITPVYAAAPPVSVKLEKLPAAFEVLDAENGTYLTRSEQAAIDSNCEYNGLYRRDGSALSAQAWDDEDTKAAIDLGAAVLSKIVDPAAREIAIRNALIAASNRSGQVQDVAVAEIVSAHGDPEAFGERELVALVDIQKFPYRTKLYAAAPAKEG